MSKMFKIWGLMVLVVLIVPFHSSAKELLQKLNVSCNKPWYIRFNEKIDSSTLNGNIIITDSKGKQLKTNINLVNSKKDVIVTPIDKYSVHDTYTICVNKNVKSENGQSLQEETTRKFTVMNIEDYNIDTIKNEANEDFKDFKLSIDSDKNNYGLEDYEKANDMYMDKGFEYYYISSGILNQENPNLNNIDDIIYSSNEVIFFNKINGKNVDSTSVYHSDEGKWKVFRISSLNFYNDILDAEKKYSLKDGDFKLVYDEGYQVTGLLVTNNSQTYFINLTDKWVVNADKFEKVDMKNLVEDLKKYNNAY